MGLQSKMSEWMDGVDAVDTPQTVTTTRAPAVLKTRVKNENNVLIN